MPAATKATSLYRNVRKGFDYRKASTSSSHTRSLDPSLDDADGLPIEIWITVLSLLKFRDLLIVRRVSRFFREVIDSVPEIQYHIELEIAGLASTTQDKYFGHAEKIQALRNIQLSRARKYIIEDARLPVDQLLGERSGNVFCSSYSTSDNNDKDFSDAVQCVSVTSHGPNVHPTVVRWNLVFRTGFSRLCADAEQDLLVLLRPTGAMEELPDSFNRIWIPPIRIVSMQTGTPFSPSITAIATPGSSDLDYFQRCKIRGSILGLIKHGRDEDSLAPASQSSGMVEVVLVDWKQGSIEARLVRRGGANYLPLGSEAFAFIAEDAFIFAVNGENSIEIQVFTFALDDVPSRGSVAPHHVATYEFPHWLPGCRGISPAALGSTYQNGGRNRFFKTSEDSELVLLGNVQIYSKYDWRPQPRFLWFVIRASTFLESVTASWSRASPRTLRWETWGPQSTRCFDYNSTKGTIPCAVQGSRILVKDKLPPSDNPGGQNRPELHGYILDFNVLPYHRPFVQESKRPKLFRSGNSNGRNVLSSSTLSRQEQFAEDMVTSLPYRQIPVEWPAKFDRSIHMTSPTAEYVPPTSPEMHELWVFAHSAPTGLGYHPLSL